MEAPIYNIDGKKAGNITLPEAVFGVAWNDSLMHQVSTSMLDNARTPVAHTKGRGEVRGGGKKPWRQKGTGRARHGSIRSPIWKGGGVTHGPIKDKVFARGIPKKMRVKALFMALSRKFKDGEIIFVDSFKLDAPKTSSAKKALTTLSGLSGFEKLGSKRKNAALVAFSTPNAHAVKSFRNLGHIATVSVRDLNPVTVLGNTYLILENPAEAVKIVESRIKNK